jgi:hypothetical protein
MLIFYVVILFLGQIVLNMAGMDLTWLMSELKSTVSFGIELSKLGGGKELSTHEQSICNGTATTEGSVGTEKVFRITNRGYR